MDSDALEWQLGDRFLELRSHWFTLIGEHWQDHQGQPLEYWRVERAHSVIVIPVQAEQLILPPAQFRPGVGQATLDFPGGRLPEGMTAEEAAAHILKRELGVEKKTIEQLLPINREGWIVNSSFSNQLLFGFVAHLSPSVPILSPDGGKIVFPATDMGVRGLLTRLPCLQCRALLLEWWMLSSASRL